MDEQQKVRLENLVQDKMDVLRRSACMGDADFKKAVSAWWRMYDVVAQRQRQYRGIDLYAYEAATDHAERVVGWR